MRYGGSFQIPNPETPVTVADAKPLAIRMKLADGGRTIRTRVSLAVARRNLPHPRGTINCTWNTINERDELIGSYLINVPNDERVRPTRWTALLSKWTTTSSKMTDVKLPAMMTAATGCQKSHSKSAHSKLQTSFPLETFQTWAWDHIKMYDLR